MVRALSMNNRKTPTELLTRLRSAAGGRVGESETRSRRQVVLALVAALQVLVAQILALESQIAAGLDAHPDGEIFRSFFRSRNSIICAATLLVEIGDCRARYPHRDAIAADGGQAPVAVESGKRRNAKFRWACNKRLRNALGILAHATRLWNPWAVDRYANARQRGHNHRRALRTLGRAWSRIIWRCWQNRIPYDPARHTGLQQHIAVTIPAATGHRPDPVATSAMAGMTASGSSQPRGHAHGTDRAPRRSSGTREPQERTSPLPLSARCGRDTHRVVDAQAPPEPSNRPSGSNGAGTYGKPGRRRAKLSWARARAGRAGTLAVSELRATSCGRGVGVAARTASSSSTA